MASIVGVEICIIVWVCVCVCVQARNQTFLEGGSKSSMVVQMKWAL